MTNLNLAREFDARALESALLIAIICADKLGLPMSSELGRLHEEAGRVRRLIEQPGNLDALVGTQRAGQRRFLVAAGA